MGDLTSYSRQPWGRCQLSHIPDAGKERQAPKNALALVQELDNADKKAPDPLDVFSGDEDMKECFKSLQRCGICSTGLRGTTQTFTFGCVLAGICRSWGCFKNMRGHVPPSKLLSKPCKLLQPTSYKLLSKPYALPCAKYHPAPIRELKLDGVVLQRARHRRSTLIASELRSKFQFIKSQHNCYKHDTTTGPRRTAI